VIYLDVKRRTTFLFVDFLTIIRKTSPVERFLFERPRCDRKRETFKRGRLDDEERVFTIFLDYDAKGATAPRRFARRDAARATKRQREIQTAGSFVSTPEEYRYRF
jgi:hypothetical protein